MAPSDTLWRLKIAICEIFNTLFQIFSRTKKKLQFFPVLWPCRPNIIYFALLWPLNPAREEKCEIFEALWSKFFWIPARSSPGQVSGGARDTDWHRLRGAAPSQLPHYLALLQVEQEKLAMPTFNRNVRPDTVLKESALVLFRLLIVHICEIMIEVAIRSEHCSGFTTSAWPLLMLLPFFPTNILLIITTIDKQHCCYPLCLAG